ncbi:hypothetical protein [Rufibacter psychrotolerans]|uniref:hypothetical protein n=1 Tax=Rufibacter psychrotolerans TaxID=2812556 RepID=UPI001F07E098|nr:hypothetical protein [Rufibacter sp. SYSU D00308]
MKTLLALAIALSFGLLSAEAQHEHHTPPPVKKETKPAVKQTAPKKAVAPAPKAAPSKAQPAPKKAAPKPAARKQTVPAATKAKPKPVTPAVDHSQHHMPAADTAHQHQGHQMTSDSLNRAKTTGHEGHTLPADTTKGHQHHPGMNMNHGAMATDTTQHAGMNHGMSHAFSRNLPMNRNGSGTSWHPDATPMYGYMKHAGNWMLMFHGQLWLRYNKQDIFNKGSRGDSQLDAPNWFMGMAQREVGSRGLLRLSVMLSLDELTMGDRGYPLLFQSGETYGGGKRLVDRQHPHDLFSEISVGYTHMLNKDMDVYGFFGIPAEPVIGPPVFMHRISAFNNPESPLGHHWQDATHITFGVATLGFRYKQFKLEGSNFTGREPDENRYDFDRPRFDSYAARLSYNPTENWALQVSRGWLKSPESLEPGEDVTRTTASALYSRPLPGGGDRFFTSAFIWGFNGGGHHQEHSAIAEANLQLNRTAVYGRYEYVQKTPGELDLTSQFDHHEVFDVHALTLGTSQRVAHFANTYLTLGVQATVFSPDKLLRPLYGKTPVSGEIYLRLNPGLMMGGSRTRTSAPAMQHQH